MTTNTAHLIAIETVRIASRATLVEAGRSETVSDLIAQHEDVLRARLGGDYDDAKVDRAAKILRTAIEDVVEDGVSDDDVIAYIETLAAPTADRLGRLAAIIRASDDEGTIQAGRMVRLFPGRPTLHTATDVRSALAAASATAEELRALARATDDDAVEACALHQAQTWDD